MLFNRTIYRLFRVGFTILMLNPAFDMGSRLYSSCLEPLLYHETTRKIQEGLDGMVTKG